MVEARASSTPDPERERVLDLVADAMEVLDREGEAALDRHCAGLGADREAVLARLRTLRSIGLMQQPAGDRGVPEQVGDFRLLDRIGSGGMGVVFRALQQSVGRDAAVKLIRPDQLLFPGVRERFQREVEIVARLQHDGIVRLFGFGEDRGMPWFAMELVDGVSLADVLRLGQGRDPLTLTGEDFARAVGAAPGHELFAGSWLEACLRVLERAAHAVAAAHAEGVLHRDLKPSNVMVTPAGRVVLLDFGLAWSSAADRLTRSGAPLGTVNYMAPEQLTGRGTSLDERVDVYALGVVMRELLTLRPAFAGDGFDTVAENVRAGRCSALDRGRSAATREAGIVCTMAMDRDRERRHPGAKTLARDLRNLLEHRPILATPPSLALRLRRFAERHRAVTAAAAVAGLAVVATPVVIAWRERALRRQIEAVNADLAQQVARADTNLGLAADALNRTLSRIDDESLTSAPDLKPFCDGVLVDTSAFLDALLASNPSDPAARLRLATTLRSAGHLRWQFFDLPRTAAVFHHTLELLEGSAGDADTIDEVFVDVRLALIYVERLSPSQADTAYREVFERIRSRGPVEQRSLLLQQHLARGLVRAADLAMRSGRPGTATYLDEARTLLGRLTEAHASVGNLLEAARCAATAAEFAGKQNDPEARARHEAECAAATTRAIATEPADRQDRLALLSWLSTRSFYLGQRGEHVEATSISEALVDRWAWFCDHEPSRVEHLGEWASACERLADNLIRAGQGARAAVVSLEEQRRVEAALQIWPREVALWRSLVRSQVNLFDSHVAAGAGVASADQLAALEHAAGRAMDSGVVSSTLYWSCNQAFVRAARFELDQGQVAAAGDAIDRAEVARAGAEREATAAKMRLGSDVEMRLLHAEILLRSDRLDEALAQLDLLGTRLPKDLALQVPSLRGHQVDPRVQALLDRASRGR